MSSDRQILKAIAARTQQEMRFFEILQYVWGPDKKRCVMAIGRHRVVFLRQDFSDLVSKQSQFEYVDVVKVCIDTGCGNNFLIVLDNTAGNWTHDKILIKSENRGLLLQHIQCCWQTSMMGLHSKVMTFPQSDLKLSSPPFQPDVAPYVGYLWESYEGYKFMKPEGMVSQPNRIRMLNTGEYIDGKTGVKLKVQVHEVHPFDMLRLAKREHIRWVAVEYKAKLVENEKQFYVLRSAARMKRMNLVGDPSVWLAWELVIRTQEYAIVCQLVRRQYMPPLCDSAQDMSFIFRFPVEHWAKFELQSMLQAQLVADSVTTTATTSIYRELVQAKLDALRLDEDGTEWVMNYQRLNSLFRIPAARFVKTLVDIYHKADMGIDSEILTSTEFVRAYGIKGDWKNCEPIEDWDTFFNELRVYASNFIEPDDDEIKKDQKKDRVTNCFMARAARYIAWAVDGGFLGNAFNLDILVEKLSLLDERYVMKVDTALMFMLHMRSEDTSNPWRQEKLCDRLQSGGADQFVFNDRVMQWLIHGNYLSRQFGRGKESAYYKSLAQILRTKAGTNVKAYICRMFMEVRAGPGGRSDDDANSEVVPALLHLIRSGGVYLATFASAALVNLSHENEMVKTQLMSQGLAEAAAKNIRSKDDDLICYTLTLMVNLTKEAHHRYIMANAGVLPLLYDILTSCYHQCRHAEGIASNLSSVMSQSAIKEKILTNVASLVGHFCKDEEYRDHLLDSFPYTVKCLCYICTHAVGGTLLMSKVIYALKQISASRTAEKIEIGRTVIKPIIQDQLKNTEMLQKSKPEFLMHTILLLNILSTIKENCFRMDEKEGQTILNDLIKMKELNDTYKDHVRSLVNRIREVINDEHAAGG